MFQAENNFINPLLQVGSGSSEISTKNQRIRIFILAINLPEPEPYRTVPEREWATVQSPGSLGWDRDASV